MFTKQLLSTAEMFQEAFVEACKKKMLEHLKNILPENIYGRHEFKDYKVIFAKDQEGNYIVITTYKDELYGKQHHCSENIEEAEKIFNKTVRELLGSFITW